MTTEPLTDAIDVERDEAELTAALREALGDRVDADAFATGVKARVARGEREGRDAPTERHDGWQAARGLRRAALILPPVLLPKSVAKLGLGGGAAALGKGGSLLGKGGAAGVAALPALTLLMLVVGASAVLCGLARPADPAHQDQDREWAQAEVRRWWLDNRWAALGVLGLLGALLVFAPLEAATLLLIASTLVLCGVLGRLARAGFASRREVGVRAGALMLSLAGWGYGLAAPQRLESYGFDGGWFVIPVLLVGAAVCLTLAHGWTRRRLLVAANLSAGGLALMLGTLLGVSTFTGQVVQGPDDLRAWMESPDGAAALEPNRWHTLASVQRHWRGAALEPLDLGALSAAAHTWMDASGRGGLAELELGLARPEDLQRWRDPQVVARLLDPTTKRAFSSSSDHLVARALARTRGLGDDERASLVARLWDRLPKPDRHEALERLLLSARTLEELGAADRVDDLAPLALQALRGCWARGEGSAAGGFAPAPSLVEEARARTPQLDPTLVWVDATSAAVRAMARWGVPAEVDLLALEVWLTVESRRYRRASMNPFEAQAVAALAELRALPEFVQARAAVERVPLSARLWPWRLAFATWLLVLFAVVSTWRAPVRAPEPAA